MGELSSPTGDGAARVYRCTECDYELTVTSSAQSSPRPACCNGEYVILARDDGGPAHADQPT